ncbi:MAG: glycoside hydrolase family 3 C-terminal domain-containing protein [Clostridia bacterium]|nr:glycoside hydrolase family 3 C-terminal domain-containing protein [Clostridia bacterium]
MYDLKNFTLDEKIRLLTGIDAWRLYMADGKLPEVFLSDGPHGLRRVGNPKEGGGDTTIFATAMPNVVNLGNGWDEGLARLSGSTIADECVMHGSDVLLAPGVNIKRSPLCGRNFEYFSEDPVLAGRLGKAFIEGVQSKGVGTSLKHYALNNSENDRYSASSEIDERTMREIYLTPFEIALQAKPTTVMCSYNKINGIHASENRYLLKDILRDTFGFEGIVISDWGACHNRFKSLKATLDLCMPEKGDAFDQVKEAYEKGWVSEEDIDYCAENVLTFIARLQEMKKIRKVEWTKEERHENTVKIATESMVLLKNDDGVLPLKKRSICVLGELAKKPAICGGGSSHVRTEYTQKHLADLLKETLEVEVDYEDAYHGHTCGLVGARSSIERAAKADQVVLVVGEDTSLVCEAMNRTALRLLPKHEMLIENVARVNENVIVVIEAGSAIDTSPWQHLVKGILYAGYGGDGTNEAICALLCGKSVPCGKLSETFPFAADDVVSNPNYARGGIDRYEEGILYGYRGAEYNEIPVLYPFGYGLSYAAFDYENLTVEKTGDASCTVSYDVINRSDFPAKEISEVYVRDISCRVLRPEKELKAFSKDLIPANGKKRVSVTLTERDFAYYSVNLKDWYVENGAFDILVGASSDDIRLSARFTATLPEEKQFT